jgi:hypothetical protein
MMIIAATLKTDANNNEWFEPAEPTPAAATRVVFNGMEYLVYEGEETLP